ncbi:hypothetical protein [Kiloniella sp.]|uniref:hypothetical protein n=1 Tax=Kiloniella sp. TaxID=1938587 RepID=UPI003B01BF78
MPSSADPKLEQDLNKLEAEVKYRFTNLEKWMGRISDVLDKMADNKERVITLEVSQKHLTKELEALTEITKEQSKMISALNTRITKITTGVALLAFALPLALRFLT